MILLCFLLQCGIIWGYMICDGFSFFNLLWNLLLSFCDLWAFEGGWGFFWSFIDFWNDLGIFHRACDFLLFQFWACFTFFNFFPSISFFFVQWFCLWEVSLKMAMLMIVSALERQLLIVKILVMMPCTHHELDDFSKPYFKIHFHIDPCTGILVFVVSFVYEST